LHFRSFASFGKHFANDPSSWASNDIGFACRTGLNDNERWTTTGTLSTHIGSLTDLRVLDLRFLGLTGTVPTQLARLTNLALLDLRGNNFAGPLPNQFINFGARFGKMFNAPSSVRPLAFLCQVFSTDTADITNPVASMRNATDNANLICPTKDFSETTAILSPCVVRSSTPERRCDLSATARQCCLATDCGIQVAANFARTNLACPMNYVPCYSCAAPTMRPTPEPTPEPPTPRPTPVRSGSTLAPTPPPTPRPHALASANAGAADASANALRLAAHL
jgi:hypothetical protein